MTPLDAILPRRRGPAAALAAGFIGIAAACAAPIAAGGGAGDALANGDTGKGPLRCEIVISGPAGSPSLAGRVHGDAAVSGTYRLEIRRTGHTGAALITQSGTFSVSPGRPDTLGTATLGGDPARFEATLDLRWNGRHLRCSNHRGSLEI